MTGPDPEGLPRRGGTSAALAGLSEGFLRDWVTNAVILLSLVVAGAGVATGEQPWVVVGPVAGLVSAAAGPMSVAKRWPIGRTWVALVVVLVVHITLLVVMYA